MVLVAEYEEVEQNGEAAENTQPTQDRVFIDAKVAFEVSVLNQFIHVAWDNCLISGKSYMGILPNILCHVNMDS